MARPTPIVIPAAQVANTSTPPDYLGLLQGLSLLAGLYHGTVGAGNKAAEETAGAKALATKLGMDRTTGPLAENRTQAPTVLAGEPGPGMGNDQGSYLINQPQPSGLDLNALAKSETGRKYILKTAEDANKPQKFGAINTDKGPVLYNEGTGIFGNMFNAPKEEKFTGTTIQKTGGDGNVHNYTQDPKSGMFSIDQGPAVSKPSVAVHTQVVADPKSSTGHRYMQYNEDTKKFDIPGNEAPMTYGNKPQQSNFVDENNVPYNFDPTSGNYVKAKVEGGGTLMPRKKTLTSDITDNMGSGVTYLQQIDKVAKTYNEALTGPAAGNYNKAAGIVKDNPEFQALRLNVGTLRTVVYQLSGKQINDTEQKWLENDILPNLAQPNENFKAKLGELKSWMHAKLKNQVDTFGTSYIIPKNVESYLKTPAQDSSTSSRYSKYGIKE